MHLEKKVYLTIYVDDVKLIDSIEADLNPACLGHSSENTFLPLLRQMAEET